MKRKNSALFYHVLSYLVIMFFVVSVVLVVNAIILKAVEESAYTESLTKIDRVRSALDTYLKNAETFAVTIATREDVVAIASVRNKLRPFHVYELYDLVKELRRYEASNSDWADMYIYFSNEEFVVGSEGRIPAKSYFELKSYNMSYREWLSSLNSQYYAEFKAFGDTEDGFVEYWFPLSGHSQEFKSGVAILRLNKNTIQMQLGGQQWNTDEIIAVMDSQKHILFHTTEGSIGLKVIAGLPPDGRTQFVQNGLLVSSARSGVTDWTYLSVLPKIYSIERTQYLQSIIVLCIFLTLLFFMLYFLMGLKKNYFPIRNILGMLRAESEDGTSAEKERRGSECQIIERSVQRILTDYDTAKRQLDMQKSVMRNNMLIRLLTNSLGGIVSLDDTLNFYEIVFIGSRFLVFIVNSRPEADNPEGNVPLSAINDVFLQLINAEGYSIYGAEYNGFAVCVMSLRPENNLCSEMAKIKALLAQGQKIIHNRYIIDVSIALSGVHTGLEKIADAYREALEVVSYLDFVGDAGFCVLEYARMQEKEHEEYYYPSKISTLNQLTNLIISKSFTEAKSLVKNMIEEIIGKDYDIKAGLCYMYSIMNAVIDGLSSLASGDFPHERKPIETVLSCESITQLNHKTLVVLDELESYYKNKSEKLTSDTIQKILLYIRQNYSDSSLSVSRIANVFDLKVPFLSKFFKKSTGTGLLDYTTQLRLEKVKFLLRGGGSLNDIAVKSGFINSSSLIRTFKRYEGITPGKYKEAYFGHSDKTELPDFGMEYNQERSV